MVRGARRRTGRRLRRLGLEPAQLAYEVERHRRGVLEQRYYRLGSQFPRIGVEAAGLAGENTGGDTEQRVTCSVEDNEDGSSTLSGQ